MNCLTARELLAVRKRELNCLAIRCGKIENEIAAQAKLVRNDGMGFAHYNDSRGTLQ